MEKSQNSADGSGVALEYMELEEAPDSRNRVEEELEKRKRARQINIPSADAEVIAWLRKVLQPAVLFGEERLDRRERLRVLLAELPDISFLTDETPSRQRQAREINKETWYHEHQDPELSELLLEARRWIANFSLPRAHARLARSKQEVHVPVLQKLARLKEMQNDLSHFTAIASQIADARPVPFCEFSPDADGKFLATASWSGVCKLWNIPDCTLHHTYRGHHMNASCIRWHPHAMSTQSETALNLASCAVDGSVCFWNLTDKAPIGELTGYEQRVPRLAFHPSGQFLATSSFDLPYNWRLWDLVNLKELVYQEGHSRETYCVEFNNDGSLLCSGGLDAYARMWDLRTGRCIMFMSGHTHGILSVDFHPTNGFHVLTASQDNTVKIWDMRQRKDIYTIPAHSQLVSCAKYESANGDYIVTASYDSTIRLWSHPNYMLMKTLAGHDNKVMQVDVTRNGKYIASSSFDKRFKLWAVRSEAEQENKKLAADVNAMKIDNANSSEVVDTMPNTESDGMGSADKA